MPPLRRSPLRAATALAVCSGLAAAQQASIVLTLGDAARLAARQSASVQVSQARADQADARVTQRRSELLPNLSATVQDGERTFNSASFGITIPGGPFPPGGAVLGPVRNYDLRARASVTLLDYGAWQRTRSAQSSATAARADAASVADMAANIGAIAYLRSLRADAVLRARTADSVLADELVGIAREQVRSGVGIGLDLTRAQSQAAAARAQLIGARGENDRARLDLYRALGLPLDARVVLGDSLAARDRAPLPFYQDAVVLAIKVRPDLAAAAAQLEAQRQSLSASRADRFPTIGLAADQGATGVTTDRMLNTWTWGVQVSIPIFDGFRRSGREAEQSAALRELEARDRDLRQQVTIEVRGALLDVRSAVEQSDASDTRLRLAEQELAEARDRFRAGVAGNADVITASLSLNAARTQQVDALTQLRAARVALARVMGTVTKLP
ncbi:MAG: TolC family protein [Gemmatimonadetes bacterium]|nr:TolC family protein [Gemmatimonadota bacterium]